MRVRIELTMGSHPYLSTLSINNSFLRCQLISYNCLPNLLRKILPHPMKNKINEAVAKQVLTLISSFGYKHSLLGFQ